MELLAPSERYSQDWPSSMDGLPEAFHLGCREGSWGHWLNHMCGPLSPTVLSWALWRSCKCFCSSDRRSCSELPFHFESPHLWNWGRELSVHLLSHLLVCRQVLPKPPRPILSSQPASSAFQCWDHRPVPPPPTQTRHQSLLTWG